MIIADNGYRSIADVQKAINDGKTTVKAVVEHYLKAMEELNPELNAVLALNQHALEDAEKLDVSCDLIHLELFSTAAKRRRSDAWENK